MDFEKVSLEIENEELLRQMSELLDEIDLLKNACGLSIWLRTCIEDINHKAPSEIYEAIVQIDKSKAMTTAINEGIWRELLGGYPRYLLVRDLSEITMSDNQDDIPF